MQLYEQVQELHLGSRVTACGGRPLGDSLNGHPAAGPSVDADQHERRLT